MGELNLPSAGLVYLDASGFIYSAERIEPYRTLLEPMWRQADGGRFTIVSSDLVVLETLVKPIRDSDMFLKALFNSLFDSNAVNLIPATRDIWEQSAVLRASTGLKTPDALHAATALSVRCDLFITNDTDFRRVENLPVTVLGDLV